MSQLTLPLERERFEGEADVEALAASFHAAHQAMYAVNAPEDAIEFVAWSLEALGDAHSEPALDARSSTALFAATPTGRRQANVGSEGATVDVDAYDAATLSAGGTLSGPCLVEDRLTTVSVPAGCDAVVTDEGGLLVTVGGASGTRDEIRRTA